jgi:hypothetical protein
MIASSTSPRCSLHTDVTGITPLLRHPLTIYLSLTRLIAWTFGQHGDRLVPWKNNRNGDDRDISRWQRSPPFT